MRLQTTQLKNALTHLRALQQIQQSCAILTIVGLCLHRLQLEVPFVARNVGVECGHNVIIVATVRDQII